MTIEDFETAKILQIEIEMIKKFDSIDKPDYSGIKIVCEEWVGVVPLNSLGISFREFMEFLTRKRTELESEFKELLGG